MSHPETEPPPEPARAPTDQSHEQVVEHVRDITRGGGVVFENGGGSDTGWRQVVPLTYDIPLDHPEAIRTGQEE